MDSVTDLIVDYVHMLIANTAYAEGSATFFNV